MKLTKQQIRAVLDNHPGEVTHTNECRTKPGNVKGDGGHRPGLSKGDDGKVKVHLGGYQCICDWFERVKALHEADSIAIGAWVWVEELDDSFKVMEVRDCLLKISEVVWVQAEACRKMTTSECGYCHEQKPNAKQERYSYSVYAGKMCDECAYSRYRDHCGLEGEQGNPADLDEDLEPEDYYGMGEDLADMRC
jgi:hypothetical protein